MKRLARGSVSTPTESGAGPADFAMRTPSAVVCVAGNDVTAFAEARLLFRLMTTDSAQSQWTVQGLLDLFDVQPAGEDKFIAETGLAGQDERQVVEGTQVLAQAIVAAAKRFPEKS